MQTENMTDEEYNSIIFTKEELEREFEIWKQNHIEPDIDYDINEYCDWCRTNNYYVFKIENYHILKKNKSDSIIDYNKITRR